MASPTITRARTIYLGPFRVLRFHALSAGTSDTLALRGFYSTDVTTMTTLKALISSPVTITAAKANVRITSVTGNVPTITIDGGAANDEHVIECWRY